MVYTVYSYSYVRVLTRSIYVLSTYMPVLVQYEYRYVPVRTSTGTVAKVTTVLVPVRTGTASTSSTYSYKYCMHTVLTVRRTSSRCETEFSLVRFEGDEEKASQVYAGMKPLSAEDIAEIVYWTTALPPHINVNQLEVMPVAQAWSPFVVHRE